MGSKEDETVKASIEDDRSDDVGVEVERKWLVKELPDLSRVQGEEIIQGYLAVEPNGAEVRLRRYGSTHVLTVKGGRGVVRNELEVDLTPAQFDLLWPATEDRRIEKTRFRLPVAENNSPIELDVFEGSLRGLVIAEVEFSSVENAGRFKPPPWIGEDVTKDDRYKNRCLALNGMP